MPHATCAHCKVQITDRSTMMERDGQQFCCNNCAQMASGQSPVSGGQMAQMGGTICAHCQMPITDTSTQVTRDDQTFCCNNCANAVAIGEGAAGMHGMVRDR